MLFQIEEAEQSQDKIDSFGSDTSGAVARTATRDSDFGLSDRQLQELWSRFEESGCQEQPNGKFVRERYMSESVGPMASFDGTEPLEKRDSDFGISDAQIAKLMSQQSFSSEQDAQNDSIRLSAVHEDHEEDEEDNQTPEQSPRAAHDIAVAEKALKASLVAEESKPEIQRAAATGNAPREAAVVAEEKKPELQCAPVALGHPESTEGSAVQSSRRDVVRGLEEAVTALDTSVMPERPTKPAMQSAPSDIVLKTLSRGLESLDDFLTKEAPKPVARWWAHVMSSRDMGGTTWYMVKVGRSTVGRITILSHSKLEVFNRELRVLYPNRPGFSLIAFPERMSLGISLDGLLGGDLCDKRERSLQVYLDDVFAQLKVEDYETRWMRIIGKDNLAMT